MEDEWDLWRGQFRLTWPRDIAPDDFNSLHIDEKSLPEDFRRFDDAARRDRLQILRIGLTPDLERRPAIIVPTNRQFATEVALALPFTPQTPGNWASFLADLEHNPEADTRAEFGMIATAFADITEGLTLICRLVGAATRVQVAERGAQERDLGQCGDGLRDLAAILLFAHHFPRHDLLLEEPGLRLHPGAQRRLMKHLEALSKERAIWITSHEGAFIGSPLVARRFEVRRVASGDRSEVSTLLDRDGARRALVDLGWTPQDAFLAEQVLFGEGDSDVVAFTAAMRWLTDEGVRIEDTLAADLGGVGFVFEGRATQATERVLLAREAAPHVKFVALIDSDGRKESEVETARARLQGLGIAVALLPCVELENLWLDPKLLTVILREHATSREVDAETVEAITNERVEAELERHDIEHEKGSSVIRAVAKNWHLDPGKREIAELAVRFVRDLAPESASKLKQAVRDALGQEPPKAGSATGIPAEE